MDSGKSVTASFGSSSWGVDVAGSYFTSIQGAYDAAYAGDILKVRSMSFSENLIFNIGDTIILKGGYDCTFTTNAGNFSTIHGALTISDGTVEVQKIIIAP
jgi:hypothetical protein